MSGFNLFIRNSRDGFIVLFLTLFLFLIQVADVVSPGFLFLLCVALFVFIFRNKNKKGALDLSLFLVGVVLYIFPYLGELARYSSVSLLYFIIFIPVIWLISILSPLPSRSLHNGPIREAKGSIAIFLLISVVGLHIWRPIYAAGYAVAIINYERLCRSSNASQSIVFLYGSIFYLCLVYNYIFIWSGFGRLEFLTYLLLPLLIAIHYRRILIKDRSFILLVFIGIVIGQIIRSADQFNLSAFATGSISHHLLLMDMLEKDESLREGDIFELFEQFFLYFLNWFPRDVWLEKPLGVGYWFVDLYLGRQGFSEAHSVSLGFWGEHIFLNPRAWLFSGLIAVIITIFSSWFIFLLNRRYLAVVLMFYVNFLTLFWGGMASFGSRVWWLVIPACFYLLVRKFLLTFNRS